jgi:hypothetical protein
MDKKTIDGIKCEVSNCIYHDTENHCHAGEIKVGPHSASEQSETCCDTFKCDL